MKLSSKCLSLGKPVLGSLPDETTAQKAVMIVNSIVFYAKFCDFKTRGIYF